MSMSPSFIDKLKKTREAEKKAESDRAAEKLVNAETLRRARAIADSAEMAEELEKDGFIVRNPAALKASLVDFQLRKPANQEEAKRMLIERLEFLKKNKIIE